MTYTTRPYKDVSQQLRNNRRTFLTVSQAGDLLSACTSFLCFKHPSDNYSPRVAGTDHNYLLNSVDWDVVFQSEYYSGPLKGLRFYVKDKVEVVPIFK
uniref:DUF3298 domain-containing protein n=1 Tax=Heterorhabditis bacteriophora TaxID=37862 RepID=A0A1I7XUN0_HETBA